MSPLLESLTRALEPDPRVRAIFLTGSRARGEADGFSDLDLLVVCDPTDLDGFVTDLRAQPLDGVPATLLENQLNLGEQKVITRVAQGWKRYDISVEPVGMLSQHARGATVPLVDPDGLASQLGEPEPVGDVPAARVTAMVEEFLRCMGLYAVAHGRRDWVTLASGASLLRLQALQLFALPLPRAGLLRLRSHLSPSDYAVLASLPPIAATEQACLAFHRAIAEVFLAKAHALASQSGARWPTALEDACRDHLAPLGIALPREPVLRPIPRESPNVEV